MTLRKSIILSLVLHMLIFGTGLAFARFAGELFVRRPEAVMVTLIGKGGSFPDDGREKIVDQSSSRHEPKKSRLMREQSVEKQAPTSAQKPEKQSPIPDNRFGQSEDEDRGPVQQDARADAGGGKGNGESGQAAGSPSGAVSSEQWAVIVSSLERVKTYPRMARERGIEGVARVRFRLKSSGDVETVEIVESSGSDILDSASVRTVYRAAPLPYVNGWVEVPIAYVLK